MYFIRLFKVTGHLGKQFILSDTNIDSKTKLISNSVLDSVRQRYGIRIDPMGAAHIEIALIDAGFFYDRGIFSANIHELSGVLFIKLEIRSGHEKIRAFAERDLPVALFVMAGHSYEFQVLNHWGYMEELLQYIRSFGFEVMTTMEFVNEFYPKEDMLCTKS